MSKPGSKEDSHGPSRRQFAKSLAAIAAMPFLSSRQSARADESDLIEPGGPQAAQQAEQPLPESEALIQLVRLRYGKNLSEDQLKEVRRSIDNRLRAAERMKQVKLANGDEPEFVFTASVR